MSNERGPTFRIGPWTLHLTKLYNVLYVSDQKDRPANEEHVLFIYDNQKVACTLSYEMQHANIVTPSIQAIIFF